MSKARHCKRAFTLISLSLLFGCAATPPKQTPEQELQTLFRTGHLVEIERNTDWSALDSTVALPIRIQTAIFLGKYDELDDLYPSIFDKVHDGTEAIGLNPGSAIETTSNNNFLMQALKAEILAHQRRFGESIRLSESILQIARDEKNITPEMVAGLATIANASRISGAIHIGRDAANLGVELGKTEVGYRIQTAQAILALARIRAELEDYESATSLFSYAFYIFRWYGGDQSGFAAQALVDLAQMLVSRGQRLALDDQGDFQDNAEWVKEASFFVEEAYRLIDESGLPSNSPTALQLEITAAKLIVEPQPLFIENLFRQLVDTGGEMAETSELALQILLPVDMYTSSERGVFGAMRSEVLAISAIAANRLKRSHESLTYSRASLRLARKVLPADSLQLETRLLDHADLIWLAVAEGTIPPDEENRDDFLKIVIESQAISKKIGNSLLVGATPAEHANWATSRYVQGPAAHLVATLVSPRDRYDEILKVKARAYREVRATLMIAHETANSEDSSNYSELLVKLKNAVGLEARRIFSIDNGQLGGGLANRHEKIKLLESTSDSAKLWRKLSREVWEDRTPLQNHNLQQIQSHLLPDEVVVDFVRVSAPGLFEIPHIYIYGHEGEPIVMSMPTASIVTSEEMLWILRKVATEYDSIGKDEYDHTIRFTWENFWEPIHDAITEIVKAPSTVYIVPTRSIASSPLPALRSWDGRYLQDFYSLSYLTAAQDLVHQQSVSHQSINVVGVGGINYGQFDQQVNDRGVQVAHNFVSSSLPSKGYFPSEIEFSPLGNTKPEVDAIERALGEGSLDSLFGFDATEASTQELASDRSANVLHLATHGFSNSSHTPYSGYWLDGNIKSNSVLMVPNASHSPLTFFGLALAYANDRDDKAGNDGILTGSELALWNLNHIELAVLSACDGAVGPFQTGNGMDGIHRALAYAGVRAQIVSLYPVGDEATRQLMEFFYQELSTGRTPADALGLAMQALREYEESGTRPYEAPQYWAAFVSYGPQRPLLNFASD